MVSISSQAPCIRPDTSSNFDFKEGRNCTTIVYRISVFYSQSHHTSTITAVTVFVWWFCELIRLYLKAGLSNGVDKQETANTCDETVHLYNCLFIHIYKTYFNSNITQCSTTNGHAKFNSQLHWNVECLPLCQPTVFQCAKRSMSLLPELPVKPPV